MTDLLPPLKPISIKERLSILFVEKGHLDVLDGAFVVVDKIGVRTHIPVGGVVCLMLEPGTRTSHAAVALAARVGTSLVWVGEAGGRFYSSGQLKDQEEKTSTGQRRSVVATVSDEKLKTHARTVLTQGPLQIPVGGCALAAVVGSVSVSENRISQSTLKSGYVRLIAVQFDLGG
jgi:hypothetical protein